ncbi:MAG: hypothetical protein IPO21_04530 [Bacteroidales bacterium]|nr:hypothetical protein [Bacteroidales bacterium]
MSQIEKEEYEKVKAEGDLTISNFKYVDADFPQGILISNASFQFSPQYLNILQLNSIIGKSDFSITGKIENFIPYILANQTIIGDITFNSTYLDIDELMGTEQDDATIDSATSTVDSSNSEPLQIPSNIKFNLNTNISTIIYDGIKITSESGQISINNTIAEIKNLKLKVLDGNVKLQGLFNTQNPYKPFIDINLDVDRLSIVETYNTFDIIKEMVPFAKYCKGIFGLNIDFSSMLDAELSPVLKSVNGKGNVLTKNITLSESKIQGVLADKLKQEKYKTIELKDMKISFEIINGTIKTNPFDFNFSGNTSSVSGSSSLDQSINYVMNIAVPKSNLGNANEFIDGLMSQLPTIGGVKPTLGDKLFFDIVMKGNILNPKISFIPKTSASGASVTDQLKNELTKKKEELKQEIDKAKQEAVKQIEETKQNVTNEVKKEVEETKTEVKKEVKKEAQKNLKKLLNK